MKDSVRCKCGAQFKPLDLSGNPRVACPICGAPLQGVKPVARAEPAAPLKAAAPVAASEPILATKVIPKALPKEKVKIPELIRNWVPPKGLRSHDGTSLTSRQFPWGPPPQIGDLVSADSSVLDSGPPSILKLWLIALGMVIAVGLVVEFLLLVGPADLNPWVFRGISLGTGLFCALWFLVAWWPIPPRCTYLGTHGAALLEGKWGRDQPRVAQILIFQEATALFVSRTHFYKNLMYQDTSFRFDWHRQVSEPAVLHVEGMHSFKDDLPDPDHIYHFGLRVEEAWSLHLVERLKREIAEGRTLSFPCRKGHFVHMLVGVASPNEIQSIGLGSNGIQFVYRDRVEWAPFDVFRNLYFDRGVVQVRRDDAEWFSPHGKFRIDYQDIGNAQVFFHFLAIALTTPARR